MYIHTCMIQDRESQESHHGSSRCRQGCGRDLGSPGRGRGVGGEESSESNADTPGQLVKIIEEAGHVVCTWSIASGRQSYLGLVFHPNLHSTDVMLPSCTLRVAVVLYGTSPMSREDAGTTRDGLPLIRGQRPGAERGKEACGPVNSGEAADDRCRSAGVGHLQGHTR